jgi:hypothetical protein
MRMLFYYIVVKEQQFNSLLVHLFYDFENEISKIWGRWNALKLFYTPFVSIPVPNVPTRVTKNDTLALI